MDKHEEHKRRLRLVAEAAQATFSQAHEARERALRLSRRIVRNSANAIRATHRGEFDRARELLDTVGGLVRELDETAQKHPAVYYGGFVEDALKEYVEATATLAFVKGEQLPDPDELKVGPAPYMNGLAESVGELRRYILDSLRRDDFSRCEGLLDLMDEVYTTLVSMDFPEAVTRGLRRNSDAVRGILGRTRGDLTLALQQRRLERKLDAVRRSPGEDGADTASKTLE